MKNKTTETTTFTLLGFTKTHIARLTGFHNPESTPWKLIPQLWWLKIQIAIGNLRTFLVGSRTDEELCGKRWFHLIDRIRDHKAFEPNPGTPEYDKWFDDLIELRVEQDMAYFEMLYHRTGRPQYSWSRDDMSEANIAALPDWWFDGTRAKRQLRKFNPENEAYIERPTHDSN